MQLSPDDVLLFQIYDGRDAQFLSAWSYRPKTETSTAGAGRDPPQQPVESLGNDQGATSRGGPQPLPADVRGGEEVGDHCLYGQVSVPGAITREGV